MTAPIVVIGVGNPWRGDDGVGHVVVGRARDLLTAPGADVDFTFCDGEPSRIVDAWTARELAIVVDATRGGGAPGHVTTWHDAVPAVAPATYASHALGVAHALGLGSALDRIPERLVVIGVEVADTSPGQVLSPAVAAAVDAAAGAVIEVLQAGSRATSSAAE